MLQNFSQIVRNWQFDRVSYCRSGWTQLLTLISDGLRVKLDPELTLEFRIDRQNPDKNMLCIDRCCACFPCFHPRKKDHLPSKLGVTLKHVASRQPSLPILLPSIARGAYWGN